MSDVVFILGAGASRQCGGPLMSDFLETAQRLLLTGQIEDKKADFELVFRAISRLQAVHSKAQFDIYNIESIFTALELGKVIRTFPGIENGEVENAIDALKILIVRTLEQSIAFPLSGGEIRPAEPYGEFVSLLEFLQMKAKPKLSCSVITFNYDVAIDHAMLTSDYFRPYYGFGVEPERSVPLLKLHGSLNWGVERSNDGGAELHAASLPLTRISYGGERKTRIKVDLRASLRKSGVLVEETPVIVPPSWNKADYHRDLSHVWANAARQLSEASYIFIIGYSLPDTDSFFRNLYALGSEGSKPLMRIEVFNPDDSDVIKSRFLSLIGSAALHRYSYRSMNFAEAIPTIRGYFDSAPRSVQMLTLG